MNKKIYSKLAIIFMVIVVVSNLLSNLKVSVSAQEECKRLMRKGISAAIAADMYVLVDWHILEDKNPNVHKKEAMEFFDEISSEFADSPNLIYEICNEPNGDTTWNDIAEYANEVIPVIRKNVPDSVIIL